MTMRSIQDGAVSVGTASGDSRAAAEAASVQVTEVLGLAESELVVDVAQAVWGLGTSTGRDLVQALARAGTASLLALDVREPGNRPLGFAMGFIGWNDGLHLHSHQVGVVAPHRARGIGYALKMAQRAACLRHGIGEIRWTFDPLLAKNARFNLVHLGARPVAFLPDFYGSMEDSINRGDRSDRFEVSWDIKKPIPERETKLIRAGQPILDIDEGGWPRRAGELQERGTVAIPDDYAKLRAEGGKRAERWRYVTREVFQEAFERGFKVVSFQDGGYVVDSVG